MRGRVWLTRCIAGAVLFAGPFTAIAQAPLAGALPGRTVELHGLHQPVSNGYGDWSGAYARVIVPGARNTLFLDALGVRGFGERGVQGGVAHRLAWNDRWFHMLGVNVGDGSPLFPRYRTDGLIGRRWGATGAVQTVAGASYVQSIATLSDVALLGAATWYAPNGFVLESGIRYNTSRPGDINSHRVHAIAMYAPNSRRSFSTRLIGGTEGWQIVNVGTTLTRFASQELALAWRERIGTSRALNVQFDRYSNPYYTRMGVTLGVAQYW